MPHLPPEPVQTDERSMRESLRAIGPSALVAVGVGLFILLMRDIFGFPTWLSYLIFGFAVFVPLSEVSTALYLRWAMRKKRTPPE
ncbi:MAG: hypothetical protein Q8P41_00335 [Pseudomonadota bacterium]|nr:hypothetical protein [Pseudomonadota bacterium]